MFYPKGSIFELCEQTKLLKPIVLHSLAYPTGLALSPDGLHLFVCETGLNRLLKLSKVGEAWIPSLFRQFTGKFGPVDVQFHESSLFVLHSDLKDGIDNAEVVKLSLSGEEIDRIGLPFSEATGFFCDDDGIFITNRQTVIKLEL
ncbi:hypothetical protein GEMRC1_002172 [Eukaryota sp. GEM-RC1]